MVNAGHVRSRFHVISYFILANIRLACWLLVLAEHAPQLTSAITTDWRVCLSTKDASYEFY